MEINVFLYCIDCERSRRFFLSSLHIEQTQFTYGHCNFLVNQSFHRHSSINFHFNVKLYFKCTYALIKYFIKFQFILLFQILEHNTPHTKKITEQNILNYLTNLFWFVFTFTLDQGAQVSCWLWLLACISTFPWPSNS